MSVDSLEWLKKFGDNEVALYVTSPPWDYKGGGKSAKCTTYDLIPDDEIVAYFAEMYRTTTPGGCLYCFVSKMRQFAYAKLVAGVGWKYRTCAFWDKTILGLGKWGGQVEPVWIWSKGTPTPFNKRMADLLSFPSPGKNKIPPEVYLAILQMSAKPNDIVCDPFAGSDPLAAAAMVSGLQLQVRTNDIKWPEPRVFTTNPLPPKPKPTQTSLPTQ